MVHTSTSVINQDLNQEKYTSKQAQLSSQTHRESVSQSIAILCEKQYWCATVNRLSAICSTNVEGDKEGRPGSVECRCQAHLTSTSCRRHQLDTTSKQYVTRLFFPTWLLRFSAWLLKRLSADDPGWRLLYRYFPNFSKFSLEILQVLDYKRGMVVRAKTIAKKITRLKDQNKNWTGIEREPARARRSARVALI